MGEAARTICWVASLILFLHAIFFNLRSGEFAECQDPASRHYRNAMDTIRARVIDSELSQQKLSASGDLRIRIRSFNRIHQASVLWVNATDHSLISKEATLN